MQGEDNSGAGAALRHAAAQRCATAASGIGRQIGALTRRGRTACRVCGIRFPRGSRRRLTSAVRTWRSSGQGWRGQQAAAAMAVGNRGRG